MVASVASSSGFNGASSTPQDGSTNSGGNTGDITQNRTFVIAISTGLSVVGVILICIVVWLCLRKKRRGLFNRGITPIGDDEIATWKVGRSMTANTNNEDGPGSSSEKENNRFTSRSLHRASQEHQRQMNTPHHSTHHSTATTATVGTATPHHHHKKASSSLIQYQHSSRQSNETAVSPRSFINGHGKPSYDEGPGLPSGAVLARAPNARSGLTDETVPGDAPFVSVMGSSPPKRMGSKRLQKAPPALGSSPPRHGHHGSGGAHSYYASPLQQQQQQYQSMPQQPQNAPSPRRSRGSRSSSSIQSIAEAWRNVGGGLATFEQHPPSPMLNTNFNNTATSVDDVSPITATSTTNSIPLSSYPHHQRGSSHPRSRNGEDNHHYTVLSPPPAARRPEDIGRAIG